MDDLNDKVLGVYQKIENQLANKQDQLTSEQLSAINTATGHASRISTLESSLPTMSSRMTQIESSISALVTSIDGVARELHYVNTGAYPTSPTTRFTLANGTVEEYNIVGSLDDTWMQNNEFYALDYWWYKSIVNVEIGSNVTNIGYYTFYYSNLTNVSIPDSVTNIGWNAFSGCSGLTSVTIGNSVTSIGSSAFSDCSGLTNVTFQGKTLSQVQSMSNYPWGISNTSIINVA